MKIDNIKRKRFEMFKLDEINEHLLNLINSFDTTQSFYGKKSLGAIPSKTILYPLISQTSLWKFLYCFWCLYTIRNLNLLSEDWSGWVQAK